uniref:Uncharacterized protein n=1 Tax=Oryza barthii TaxID=65489 RepID=A0A0D3EMY3_9ORYZ
MEGGGAGVEGVEETAWSARGWEVDGGRIHDHRGWTHPNLLSGNSTVMTTTARRRMATLLAAVRMGGNNFDNDQCLPKVAARGARRVEVAGNDGDAITCEGWETPGERPSPFRATSDDTLGHCNPVRGIVVVSLLSMVESSGESHALVPRTGDGAPLALQPLEKLRLENEGRNKVIPNLLASSMEKEDGCSHVGGAVASDCVEDGCRYRGAASATCVECGGYGVE